MINIFQNISYNNESYWMNFDFEIVFVKRPRFDFFIIVLIITLLIEYNVFSEFSYWRVFFGGILLFPLFLISIYNEQLIFNKKTLEVTRKSYFYQLLLTHQKIIRLNTNDKLLVKALKNEDDSTYYLYVNRKHLIMLFSFRQLQSFNLLKEKLKEELNVEVTYIPFEITMDEYYKLNLNR